MPTFFKKSNHVLIQTDSSEDWSSFFDCCDGYLIQKDFNRLHEFLREDVRTIVLEKGYHDADYRNTFYNFFSHKFGRYPDTTLRVHFFSRRISPRMLFKLDRYQDFYIGFSVIRPNRVTSIGRTVLNPKMLSQIQGYVCMSEYPVHILGAELVASGFPYISQDTDVTVCAHAACWMVFRYFSQRYRRYAEIWPYEVTQLTHDFSQGRLVPSKGLTAWQITEMFSRFGFYPEIYMRDDPDHGSIFDQLLYQYVESGLPVVAALTGHGHAITIIGHISDFASKGSGSTSERYLKGFLANDDNHMPYHSIRNNGPRPSGHWSEYKVEDIDIFVVPLYQKIHLSAEHVMRLSEAILEDTELGVDARSNLLSLNQVITRTFLTSSKSYKLFRRKQNLPYGISKVYSELQMPKFIWVCEISTPGLFSAGQVVGEILFDATANHWDRFAFLSIHYPDFLLLNDRSILTDDPKRFIVRTADASQLLPYQCYINNLHEA